MKRSLFLLGASSALIAVPAYAAGFTAHLAAISRGSSGILGACCRTLADAPPVFAFHEHDVFPTASIIKVLIMTTAFVAEERHPGTLDETIRFSSSELIGGSDFLANAYDGQTFRVRDLIVPMIQVSDNTAANMLMGFLGIDRVNAVGESVGMERTKLARKFLDYSAIVRHEDNVTTPADMAQLLFTIARGAREGIPTVCSADHCRRMIQIMLGQTDRDAIPAALPPGTQIANKTGEINGTRNDVAIVEPFEESPYVLTVLTKEVGDYNAAYHAIHRVARLSYATLKKSNL